jgi:hypothetical protein
MADDQKDWGWYIGRDEEVYTSGPETYEDAVRIAREEYEGAHICEAYKAPVPLASFFDVHGWLEQCEDQTWDEYVGENGDALFDVTPEDREALQVAVRAAIEKWQSDRGLVFMPFMFTECRNHQYIPAPAEASS